MRLWVWVFALLLVGGGLKAEPAIPAGDPSLFYQEVGREVGRVLKKRDGVVVWIDRQNGLNQTFGNAGLMDQAFLPGSLMKLVTAELALRTGKPLNYRCTGHDRIRGKIRHCWIREGHGEMDLAKALGQSCNLYFSRLGTELGFSELITGFLKAGFAGAERLSPDASLPTDAADLAIGDLFEFEVNPKEMKNYWLSLLDRIASPEFAAIRQGLLRAVREGTAKKLGSVDLQILGKTGTGDARRSAYKTNGWFLGAYPVENPRWALVVFLKEAHGFEEAAALAERIFSTAKQTGLLR